MNEKIITFFNETNFNILHISIAFFFVVYFSGNIIKLIKITYKFSNVIILVVVGIFFVSNNFSFSIDSIKTEFFSSGEKHVGVLETLDKNIYANEKEGTSVIFMDVQYLNSFKDNYTYNDVFTDIPTEYLPKSIIVIDSFESEKNLILLDKIDSNSDQGNILIKVLDSETNVNNQSINTLITFDKITDLIKRDKHILVFILKEDIYALSSLLLENNYVEKALY